MRDPELTLRAQRAATELERAWDRWRTMHGLGTEPMPPVSSYVGYSLEEPWGQPRVVFGIAAAEAEHLAALLDRHDCAGPVYAAMTSQGTRPELNADTRDRGRGVHVPTQAPAGPAAREVPAGRVPQGSRPDPLDPLMPTAGTDALEGEPEGPGEGQADLVAFRPRHEPAPSHGEVDEAAQIADRAAEAAEAWPVWGLDPAPARRPFAAEAEARRRSRQGSQQQAGGEGPRRPRGPGRRTGRLGRRRASG